MPRLSCRGRLVFLATQLPVEAQPKEKKPPRYFTNSLGMKFAWIEPGSFTMGSPKREKERNELEVQHPVKLTKGFFMGVYPVTQKQWGEAIRDPNFVAPAEGFDLSNPSRFRGDGNLPVETVNWDDCQLFIKK